MLLTIIDLVIFYLKKFFLIFLTINKSSKDRFISFTLKKKVFLWERVNMHKDIFARRVTFARE